MGSDSIPSSASSACANSPAPSCELRFPMWRPTNWSVIGVTEIVGPGAGPAGRNPLVRKAAKARPIPPPATASARTPEAIRLVRRRRSARFRTASSAPGSERTRPASPSRKSWRSGIDLTSQQVSERRPGADPERRAGSLVGHPEPLDKHHGFPLAVGEGGERSMDGRAVLDGLLFVRSRVRPSRLPRGHGQPAEPAPPEVQRGPVQVADRVPHVAHPLPPFEHPDERLLGQVLGLVAVARGQVHGSEQPLVVSVEEVLEGLDALLHGLLAHHGHPDGNAGGPGPVTGQSPATKKGQVPTRSIPTRQPRYRPASWKERMSSLAWIAVSASMSCSSHVAGSSVAWAGHTNTPRSTHGSVPRTPGRTSPITGTWPSDSSRFQ